MDPFNKLFDPFEFFKSILKYFNIDLNRYYEGGIGLKEIFEELAEKMECGKL